MLAACGSVAGCGDDLAQDHLMFETAHFRYYATNKDRVVCDRTPYWIERVYSGLSDYLGAGVPAGALIDYHLVEEHEVPDRCGQPTSGCTDGLRAHVCICRARSRDRARHHAQPRPCSGDLRGGTGSHPGLRISPSVCPGHVGPDRGVANLWGISRRGEPPFGSLLGRGQLRPSRHRCRGEGHLSSVLCQPVCTTRMARASRLRFTLPAGCFSLT